MKLLIMIRNMFIINVFLFLIFSIAVISLHDTIISAAWRTTGPVGEITRGFGEKTRVFKGIMADVEADVVYLRQSLSFQDLFKATPDRGRGRIESISGLYRNTVRNAMDPGESSLKMDGFGSSIFAGSDQLSKTLIRTATGGFGLTEDRSQNRYTMEEVADGISRISANRLKSDECDSWAPGEFIAHGGWLAEIE